VKNNFWLSRIYTYLEQSNELISGCSGIIEVATTKIQKNQFKGNLKIQFDKLAFENKKSNLYLQIHIFTPNDLEKPIIILQSPIFKVYSRKPSVTTTTTTTNNAKKRKLVDLSEDTTTNNNNNNMEEFKNKLDELLKIYNKKIKSWRTKNSYSIS